MYTYHWDEETGGPILEHDLAKFSKEPRPVYAAELDLLGFNAHWTYDSSAQAPLLWAESGNYLYRGKLVAKAAGGKLFTPPAISILHEGLILTPVDIVGLTRKNREVMESVVNSSIKRIYQVYMKYKKPAQADEKVYQFYVAFSGGKDSVVTLDLVQRVLPHSDFIVLFGDTGMEFPDTYRLLSEIESHPGYTDVRFYSCSAGVPAVENWKIFGPPAHTIRWCCTVHKTAPQMQFLRDFAEQSSFRSLGFTGIRKDESLSRGGYDDVGQGNKHYNQYSAHPILEWGSAELWLYLLERELPVNDAYKKGNSRVGCLVCPNSSGRHEYMKYICYPKEMDPFLEVARQSSNKNFPSQHYLDEFMENGGWKMRKSGRELLEQFDQLTEIVTKDSLTIGVKGPLGYWKEWMSTIGKLLPVDETHYHLSHKARIYLITLTEENDETVILLSIPTQDKTDMNLISLVRSVFHKSVHCVGCQACVADCPYGYLKISKSGAVSIDENCRNETCLRCHSIDYGCVRYNSIRNPKGAKHMESLDRYLTFGVRKSWIDGYVKYKEGFWNQPENDLGVKMVPALRRFLKDTGLSPDDNIRHSDRVSPQEYSQLFLKTVERVGTDQVAAWGLMAVNLCYTPQFRWYIENMELNQPVTPTAMKLMLETVLQNDHKGLKRRNIVDAFKNIFVKTPMGEGLGIGVCDVTIKVGASGKETITLHHVKRTTWAQPDAQVFLFGLYRFAEAMDGHYQFSLNRLFTADPQGAAVSPAQMFGLDRDVVEKLLTGLSNNYSEFVSASFTHDLDTITLRPNKSSLDVLALF